MTTLEKEIFDTVVGAGFAPSRNGQGQRAARVQGIRAGLYALAGVLKAQALGQTLTAR